MGIRHLEVENLKIQVYPNAMSAGAAAANAAAEALKELGKKNGDIGVIVATGASQLEMIRTLVKTPGLPWERVRAFHMDEYVGMPPDHPASFRRYLREELTNLVPIQKFFEVNGNASDPEQACRDYAAQLRSATPQLCLLGIGENGHLAFNDPDEADFNDPVDMKIVHLDTVCRQQQAAEGWFKSLEDVPDRAMTLTIPALFRVPKLIVSVPGHRKAKIVRRTLEEPIATNCPATILRTHPNVTIFLDEESAAELDDVRAVATPR